MQMPRSFPTVSTICCALFCLRGVIAAEAAAIPTDDAPVEDAGPWSHEARIGGFWNNVATDNAEHSRDESIRGSSDKIAFQVEFDGRIRYERDAFLMTQDLLLRYGEERLEDGDWEEQNDLIEYRGFYDYSLGDPHFIYLSSAFDTVFTGVDPDNHPADPFTAWGSGGYGQRYRDELLPDSELVGRLGVRYSKKWGRGLGAERDGQIGPEFILDWSHKPDERVDYEVRYELLGDFEDMDHLQHLLAAQANVQLIGALNLKLELRGYYETRPDDAPMGAQGYDELSWRQETLIGLVYEF